MRSRVRLFDSYSSSYNLEQETKRSTFHNKPKTPQTKAQLPITTNQTVRWEKQFSSFFQEKRLANVQ